MHDESAIKTELTESGYSTLQSSCIETSTDSEDEFDFDIMTPDDLSKYRVWYDRLLSMREQYLRKERGAFPPFPPPPLRSTMIAASQAFYVNPFEEIKNSKVKNVEQLFQERNDQLYSNRFHPSDFQPLPPPHVFLEIIQTLAPHEYVDLTYALAGAILLEVGVRIPIEFPPLPPRMEPFSKWLDEKEEHSDVSSQSSSDGEYSDDSECTKMEKETRRKMNKKRREERRHRILNNQKEAEANCDEKVDPNPERIVHNLNYKQRTINEFIPQKPPPPTFYPLMSPFFNFPVFAGFPYWILGMPIMFYPPCFPSNFFYQNQNISPEEKPESISLTPSPKPDVVELEESQTKQSIDEITVKIAKPEENGRKKKFNKKSNHHHHKNNKTDKTEQYKRNPNYYNKLTLKPVKKS